MENAIARKYKWFWPWQDEQEEGWLRKISQQGWHLRPVGGQVRVGMDRLAFNRQFRKGMTGLLTGLKYYVETGEEVIDRVPTKEGASRQQRSGSNHPA